MRIAQEEVFGPVLSVIKFNDEDDAVSIANDSRFGLGSGVWTRDIGRAFRMSERIQAGTVWFKQYRKIDVEGKGSVDVRVLGVTRTFNKKLTYMKTSKNITN